MNVGTRLVHRLGHSDYNARVTYPSKQDAWIVALVFGAGAVLAYVAIEQAFFHGLRSSGAWVPMTVAAFYLLVVFGLAYPVSYELTETQLFIRSGKWIRLTIPVDKIRSVSPTRNPMSAPAWSLDRLRIDYDKQGRSTVALISPANKKRFLDELVSIDEGLELIGDEVRRVK